MPNNNNDLILKSYDELVSGTDGGNDDTGGDSDCNTSTGNGGGQFSKKQRKAR